MIKNVFSYILIISYLSCINISNLYAERIGIIGAVSIQDGTGDILIPCINESKTYVIEVNPELNEYSLSNGIDDLLFDCQEEAVFIPDLEYIKSALLDAVIHSKDDGSEDPRLLFTNISDNEIDFGAFSGTISEQIELAINPTEEKKQTNLDGVASVMSKQRRGKIKHDSKVKRIRENGHKLPQYVKNLDRRKNYKKPLHKRRQGRRDYSVHLKNPSPIMVFSTSVLANFADSMHKVEVSTSSEVNSALHESKYSTAEKLVLVPIVIVAAILARYGVINMTPQTAGTMNIITPEGFNSGKPLYGI